PLLNHSRICPTVGQALTICLRWAVHLPNPGTWGANQGSTTMLEKIACGLSKIAFAAAQDRRFAVLMRRAFRGLGTLSFRLAVLLEGRALAAICEGPANDSRAGTANRGLARC